MRGINVGAVSTWLTANVSGAVAPFTFALITGGRSNLTFKVTGADGVRFRVQWVESAEPAGLWMIVNPEAAQERQGRHFCQPQ